MIKFIRGDCLRVMRKLEAGSVDCVVTSPPYNLGISYRSGYDDATPRTKKWLLQVRRLLSDEGSLFLNIAGKPTDPWVPFQVAMVARHVFRLQNQIHWIKSYSLDGESARGHCKPLNSGRFLTDCAELVLHLTKTGMVKLDKLAVGVPFTDKSNLGRGGRGANGDLRNPGNCVGERLAVHVPYETIQSREKDRPHPATFPSRLAEYCFRLHGVDRIRRTLDPFSGLGSSARAAKRLRLDHVGIELSREDIEDAKRLLRDTRPSTSGLFDLGKGT